MPAPTAQPAAGPGAELPHIDLAPTGDADADVDATANTTQDEEEAVQPPIVQLLGTPLPEAPAGASAGVAAGLSRSTARPAAVASATATGPRRIQPGSVALLAQAHPGLQRQQALPTDPAGAPPPSAQNALAPALDARPLPSFGFAPTAGQTTGAETARQHARAWQGVGAADASQAKVWQLELPVSPHADALQLTLSQRTEAGATGRAESVWALSLPAHRHARAALDALRMRLQRRGLSVAQVEEEPGSEPSPR